jgi:hypothetical protein
VAGEDEPEATGPTSIEFRPAQPEPASERVSEAPEEPAEPAPGPEAPGAPAVFLEPQNAEEPDERSPDEEN